MRDIDFEELDKAVNRFLGKPEVAPEQAPITENVDKNTTKTDEETHVISVKIKNKKRDLKDNFSEKSARRPHRKSVDILDNFESVKYEEPILEVFENEDDSFFSKMMLSETSEKVMPELKSANEPAIENFVKESSLGATISEEFSPSSEEFAPVLEEPILTAEESASAETPLSAKPEEPASPEIFPDVAPAEIAPASPIRPVSSRIFVPSRPGVFQIEEQEELQTFGVKNASVESREEVATQEALAEILADEPKQDLTIDVPQISDEPRIDNFAEKISVEIEEKTESSPTEESQPSKVEVQPKISEEELENLKTRFVKDLKIEKRPLCAPMPSASATNMDIKPVDRSKQIRRAKHENHQPATPILSREEYSAPVAVKKKKSGWGVVFLIILLLAVCGVGAGYLILNYFG